MNELNHGPGKGSADRSPGYRRNIGEVDFHRPATGDGEGFARRGNRLVKVYDKGRKAQFRFPEEASVCGATCARHLSESTLCGKPAVSAIKVSDSTPAPCYYRCQEHAEHAERMGFYLVSLCENS